MCAHRMSDEKKTGVDITQMREVRFDVVEIKDGVPVAQVVGVDGQTLAEPIPMERFDEMVNSIGDKIADVMLKAVEEAAELEKTISDLTDSEKVLANYLVRYSAWRFAVQSNLPIFLFHPESIPEEYLVDESAESVNKAFTKQGYRKIKKAGKKVWVPESAYEKDDN